ncbi:CPBP family intramembrane glutamic endopeptidase [Evansella halocellulosilytica]|uniref:CPBP family intramembrane glutamic endopeptidase n=1 Tax=Evansella halocellulosilytica TaxID=2011013 RepID=UPI000BB8721F|nr:CPBP family intramembrane glutamic endopeptidase [Evansella halocellulosilytica]
MNPHKPWRSFLIFLLLGLIGALTLIPMLIETVEIQIDHLGIDPGIPIELLGVLSIMNPLILIILATVIGHLLARKVGLTSFIYEKDVFKKPFWASFKPTMKHGIIGGIAAGLIIIVADLLFIPWLPEDLVQTTGSPDFLQLLSGVLYGGIVEEIMIRWGFMTLIVWVIWRLFQRKKAKPAPFVFWVSIILSSLVFAIGHYPATAATTTVTTAVFIRMLILNGAAGMIFGWLYWKKGLETAMLAHIFAHITMGIASLIFIALL